MVDKIYKVYRHTCPNGKVYIGITRTDTIERWRNSGKGYKTQFFYKAIQKYGWENIKHEILFEGLSKEEAEERETELIKSHKSNNASFGYNIDNGGKTGNRMSEATKEKLRAVNIGRHHSEEAKQKMSLSHRDRKLSDQHKKHISDGLMGHSVSDEVRNKLRASHTGKPMSIEAKEKISLAFKGAKHPNCKPIILVDKDGNVIREYKFISECAEDLGVSRNSITAVCMGRQAQTKGYIFRYKI